MKKTLIATCAMAMACAAAQAAPSAQAETTQQTQALSRAQIRAATEELAATLERIYVFPEVGARYAARLRTKTDAGGYDALRDPTALASEIDADLRGVQADGHMRVRVTQPDRAGAHTAPSPTDAFGQGAWFSHGVAYLPIRSLPGDAASQTHMAELLTSYAGARALILDLRTCYGGAMPVMDVLLSRLYDTRTQLLTMDTRAGAAPELDAWLDSMPTAERVTAPEGLSRWRHWSIPATDAPSLANARVYVLTDHTVSACEHLALALKRTGRATLVGGRTTGAGHYGQSQFFGDGRFNVFVGVGRTYDPDTGQGWEGVGIEPNVAVPPQDALAYVLSALNVRAPQASSSTSQ